jgi:hypothetical protein
MVCILWEVGTQDIYTYPKESEGVRGDAIYREVDASKEKKGSPGDGGEGRATFGNGP